MLIAIPPFIYYYVDYVPHDCHMFVHIDPAVSESVGSADSINQSDEEEEDELDDRCNSAGEEIEDEEFDESHIEDSERRGLSETTYPGASSRVDGESFFSGAVSAPSSVFGEI